MTLARAIVLAGAVVSMGTDCSAQTLRILAPPEGTSEPYAIGISKNGRYIVGGASSVVVLWGPSRRPVVLEAAGQYDIAFAVSDDGRIVVGKSDGRATIWTPQGVLFLGQGEVRDVDARGVVAVLRLGQTSFAYHIPTGTFVELLARPGGSGSGVNAVSADGTRAVGSSWGLACVWRTDNGQVTVLESDLEHAWATGISDDGRIIGGDCECFGGGEPRPGRWIDGVFSMCWGFGNAFDLSGDGSVLVGWTSEDKSGAIMWDDAHGLRWFNDLFQGTGQLENRYLFMAKGISSDGNRVVGDGVTIQDPVLGFAWEVVLCPADFNADSVVDFFDYLDFVQSFMEDEPVADLNTDGQVDFFDYLDFVVAFDAGCE